MERVKKNNRNSLRTEAVTLLFNIRKTGRYLQDLLQELFEKDSIPEEKDRHLLYEITEGVLRHKAFLDYLLSLF